MGFLTWGTRGRVPVTEAMTRRTSALRRCRQIGMIPAVAGIADTVADAVALFGAHVRAAPGAYDFHSSRLPEGSRGRDVQDAKSTVLADRQPKRLSKVESTYVRR